LTTKSKQVHDRAEAEFKKQSRAQEARAAASEYGAELLALRTKTERLRALRLAKEAADAAAEAQSAAEGQACRRHEAALSRGSRRRRKPHR
jgi:hypothetical protein